MIGALKSAPNAKSSNRLEVLVPAENTNVDAPPRFMWCMAPNINKVSLLSDTAALLALK